MVAWQVVVAGGEQHPAGVGRTGQNRVGAVQTRCVWWQVVTRRVHNSNGKNHHGR